MTSPVDFISGPSTASSPGKRAKGSTGFFTATSAGSGGSDGARSASRAPAMMRAASRASGSPTAFDTNGTVREARGLASSTYSTSFLTAYCTFKSPRTPSARPSRALQRLGVRARGDALRLPQLELRDQRAETRPVLGEVEPVPWRAPQRHARVVQRARELERRLAAELHDHAHRLLGLDHVEHV